MIPVVNVILERKKRKKKAVGGWIITSTHCILHPTLNVASVQKQELLCQWQEAACYSVDTSHSCVWII